MICFWDCPPLPILRWQHYRNSKEDINWIPSLFKDEITLTEKHKVLWVRLDYNNNHGAIFTPRLAYKWKINDNNIVRFNTGTGFLVNLFTEEHAALPVLAKSLS
jgi:outer membrane receptor for ferrienterochelin and colicins